MTTTIARMQRANRGSHFQAYRFHGATPAQLDPFIGIDHAWMSEPTFPRTPMPGSRPSPTCFSIPKPVFRIAIPTATAR